MRILPCLLLALLSCLFPGAAIAAETASPPPPTTVELVEDLRVLSLVNALHPTREQVSRLAAVADSAKEALEKLDAELKQRLDRGRDSLLAARRKLLLGGSTPAETDAQLATAHAAIQTTRAARLETLVQSLTARVQRILTREQAELIETELAPSFDQPWRAYARMLSGPGAATPRAGTRLPADPGRWLGELRDLRIDSAEGDPAHEIQDFGKKMTRGLTPGTPLQEQAAGQAREFAARVLAMPPNVFAQRERELARLAARQELATRNEQRLAEGKPVERFDPYRWFVEEVLLSPRASADLHERASAQ